MLRFPPVLALAFAIAGAGAACTRGEPAPPPPSDERADARTLEAVLAADMQFQKTMTEVGQRARTDGPAAAALVEARAIPDADRMVQVAEGAAVKSAWGTERKRELGDIARDQRAELPRYAAALRAGDLKAILTETEAQLALGQRAMTAAAHVTQVPP